MIGQLNRGLPARAQRTVIDWICRVAFQFFRGLDCHDAGLAVAHRLEVGVHDADVEAASRAAQRADARLPLGDTGHDVFVRHEADQLMLRVAAAVSAALVPVIAVSLMKSRRSIVLEVTREAIVGRVLLPVAVHAEAHRVIHFPLGHRHLAQVAVAGCAVDAGANVRRVVEAHVRFVREAVDPLPRNLDALLQYPVTSLISGRSVAI